MEALEAENEEGQRYTLAELQDLSPSNPVIKLAELMTRMRGFEEIALAASQEYVGLFITVTCPSKYHAVRSGGERNPKFNGATPQDGQGYLNGIWCRVRAAWMRAGIQPFGMRVVEPHHDGTPHWHLLLFVPHDLKGLMLAIFRKHAMEEDGLEWGAAEHRFKVEEIDPERGSATGYIAKYIAKNVNGQGLETDLYGRDAVQSALRIEAWASIWGIRQFQQIGGPSVTVYREARRLDREGNYPSQVDIVRQAADDGDWGLFVQVMGGPICPRKQRPIRPLMAARNSLNQYGEKVWAIRGLAYGAMEFVTRIHNWIITPKENSHKGILRESTGALGDQCAHAATITDGATFSLNGDSPAAPGALPLYGDSEAAPAAMPPIRKLGHKFFKGGCGQDDLECVYTPQGLGFAGSR